MQTTLDFEPTDCTGPLAMAALSVAIEQAARLTKHQLGFDACDAARPYASYTELRRAYDHSQATGQPLPIYDGDMDTIYADDETELALRFWTVTLQAELGLGFSIGSRLVVAERQLGVLERAGFTPGCEVHTIFRADTIGRLLAEGAIGERRHSGSLLIRRAVKDGLASALVVERRPRTLGA